MKEVELDLSEAQESREVACDDTASGLMLRRHPLAILRPALAKACGIVTVRQYFIPTANP